MIISGKNLVFYWKNPKSGICGCLENLKEIKKGEYGYNLEPSQTVYAIRYQNTNLECYFDCKIIEVTEQGILINTWTKGTNRENIFVPWIKEFNFLAYSKNQVPCQLYIEPCEALFEKNALLDVLTGNVKLENDTGTFNYGKGIWYRHGGWRCGSKYSDNLKNFIKIDKKDTNKKKDGCFTKCENQNMFDLLKSL